LALPFLLHSSILVATPFFIALWAKPAIHSVDNFIVNGKLRCPCFSLRHYPINIESVAMSMNDITFHNMRVCMFYILIVCLVATSSEQVLDTASQGWPKCAHAILTFDFRLPDRRGPPSEW
jgi:hypothetical protein